MPLIKSPNKKMIGNNIKIEEEAGKPYNQARAIALSVRDHLLKKRLAEGGKITNNATPDIYKIVGDNLPETDYDKKDKIKKDAILTKTDPEIDALVNRDNIGEMDKAPILGVPDALKPPSKSQQIKDYVAKKRESIKPELPNLPPQGSIPGVGAGTGINPVAGGIAAFRANNPSPLPNATAGYSKPVLKSAIKEAGVDNRSEYQKMIDQSKEDEALAKDKANKDYSDKRTPLLLASLLGAIGNGFSAYGRGPQTDNLKGFEIANQEVDKQKAEAKDTRAQQIRDYLMGKEQQSADIDLKNKQDLNDPDSVTSKQFQAITGLNGSAAQIQPVLGYVQHLQTLEANKQISHEKFEMEVKKLQHTIDNDAAKNANYAQRTAQMGHRAQQSEEHRVRGDFEKSFHDDVNDIDKRQRSIEMAHGILNGNIPITNELSASIATNLANADVGGRVAHQLQQDFKADTAEGNVAKFLQYFKNNPQDTKAKAIYNVMLKGMDNGLNEVKKGLHHRIQNAGYSDDQFKKYTGYDVPQSAQQTTSKPKQVTQNGHTYTLNEETGEYE